MKEVIYFLRCDGEHNTFIRKEKGKCFIANIDITDIYQETGIEVNKFNELALKGRKVSEMFNPGQNKAKLM